jgi:hypothetical protein
VAVIFGTSELRALPSFWGNRFQGLDLALKRHSSILAILAPAIGVFDQEKA